MRNYKVEWGLGLLLSGIFFTLRFSILPYFYSMDHSTAALWAMAALTTLGFGLSLVGQDIIRIRAAAKLGEALRGLFLSPMIVAHERSSGSWWRRGLLYMHGIAFSLAVSGVLLAIVVASELTQAPSFWTRILFHLACANLTLALFQSLPVLPLDGGRLLLDSLFSNPKKNRRILGTFFYMAHVFVTVFVIVGLYQVIKHRPVIGAWIIAVGLYLWFRNEDYPTVVRS